MEELTMETWKKEQLAEFAKENENIITRNEFMKVKRYLKLLFSHEEGKTSYVYYYKKGSPEYIYYTVAEEGSKTLTYCYIVLGLNEKVDYILNNDWSFKELYSYLGDYINIEMASHVFKMRYRGWVFDGCVLNNRVTFLGASTEKEELQFWQTWHFDE